MKNNIEDNKIIWSKGRRYEAIYWAVLFEKYEFLNYGHALEIFYEAFPAEWGELQDCLRSAQITTEDLLASGGNEINIPKKFDDFLYSRGWREIKITGDLLVKMFPCG